MSELRATFNHRVSSDMKISVTVSHIDITDSDVAEEAAPAISTRLLPAAVKP